MSNKEAGVDKAVVPVQCERERFVALCAKHGLKRRHDLRFVWGAAWLGALEHAAQVFEAEHPSCKYGPRRIAKILRALGGAR